MPGGLTTSVSGQAQNILDPFTPVHPLVIRLTKMVLNTRCKQGLSVLTKQNLINKISSN